MPALAPATHRASARSGRLHVLAARAARVAERERGRRGLAAVRPPSAQREAAPELCPEGDAAGLLEGTQRIIRLSSNTFRL